MMVLSDAEEERDSVKSCFVLMPFGDHLSWVYGELVKAGDAAGYRIERGDDIFLPGVVLDQIERSIVEADAVIAVCTGRNANVFYELGVARPIHDVILVAESPEDLPFDVAHLRAIIYGTNPISLAAQVTRSLDSIDQEPKRILRHVAGEVLVERAVQAQGDDTVYWVSTDGVLRLLPDSDTVGLYTRGRPIVNLSAAYLDSLPKGKPMASIDGSSLRRINLDMFVLLDGYWHYLTTLAPVYKFGFETVREVPLLTEEERAHHRALF
jgi:hypothetical protein